MKVALLGAELEENTSLSILTKSLLGSSVLYQKVMNKKQKKSLEGNNKRWVRFGWRMFVSTLETLKRLKN